MARRKKKSVSPWLIVGIVFGVLGIMGLGCCGGLFFFYSKLTSPTSYPAETEPYHIARAKFQTSLVKRGPAPQDFDPLRLPEGVNEVPYQSGNLKLKAWVSAPTGNGRKPAVVFLHGGFAFGDEDWDVAEYFERAGYVVMMPMLRGENGQAGHYTMFYDEIDDVIAATEALQKLPYVDGSKLYLCGHSVGGTITMLTAMTTDIFKAAASFAGSTDQKLWSTGNGEYVPFKKSNLEEFRMRSPLAFPASFRCPLRMYYGTSEFLFKNMTQEAAKRAKAAGRDVEAIAVPGDHSTHVEEAIQKAIVFFKGK